MKTTSTSNANSVFPAGEFYNQSFYDWQMAASLKSARIYLRHLWNYIQPRSVLDVGCGRGTWLKACGELGSDTLVGYDGPWNDKSQMLDPEIVFRGGDLNDGFRAEEKIDLAMSLEVAEHLEPKYAERFVESLCFSADCVLFGAASVGQGGANHLNEQMPSYWADYFGQQGFVPFDLFRPTFWGNEDICYWYRQNTFLYARSGSSQYLSLKLAGLNELKNSSFMDCIHPQLYRQKIDDPGFLHKLTDLGPSLVKAIKTRIS